MLHIVLADTAMELIPETLLLVSSVQNNIQKYGSAANLLDTTWHHTAMQGLPNVDARGRPDILHHFLLDTTGSIANLNQQLKIYFHINTPKPRLFQVDSTMHPPRDYLRFKSLMYQLLTLGHIPPAAPFLIREMTESLTTWVKTTRISSEFIWKMTRTGKLTALEPMFHLHPKDQDLIIIIGGFQKGTFSAEITSLPGKSFAISTLGLDSWTVVNRILVGYEIFTLHQV